MSEAATVILSAVKKSFIPYIIVNYICFHIPMKKSKSAFADIEKIDRTADVCGTAGGA